MAESGTGEEEDPNGLVDILIELSDRRNELDLSASEEKLEVAANSG